MKKLSFILGFILLFQSYSISQQCYPEGIVFDRQSEIDDFKSNNPNCSEIIGDVLIGYGPFSGPYNLDSLINLISIGGDLVIEETLLTDLKGLDNLTTIEGAFTLRNNNRLKNTSSLTKLTSIGGLRIYSCDSLANLSGLINLTYNGGDLIIGNNDRINSIAALAEINRIGGTLKVFGNKSLNNLTGLENITSIGNDLIFRSNVFTSLTGLSNLTIVEGNFEVYNNNNFIDFISFENLTSISGTFEVYDNDSLINLSGLENLISIGGDLLIGIPDYYDYSGNPLLNSLSSLKNLASIDGILFVLGNNLLMSLEGLDNINSNSISSIRIKGNPLLSFCEVKSICDYLSNSIGSYNIGSNASGCMSSDDVKDKCESISIPEIDLSNEILLYPNPTRGMIFFSYRDNMIVEFITIYNQLGKNIYRKSNFNDRVDVSMFGQGLYIIELTSTNNNFRQKFIIK